MADFRSSLERLCREASRRAEPVLDDVFRDLRRHLAAIVDRARTVNDVEVRRFAADLTDAVKKAAVLDAVEFILQREILSQRPQRIFDFSRDGRGSREFLREMQRKYDHGFDDYGSALRQSGFVYIAWSERTAETHRYRYVGKATDASRFEFAKHSALVEAVGHSTTLSLVYPKKSTQEILYELEAALLHVVEEVEGFPPDNTKREKLNYVSTGRVHLEDAAHTLHDVANTIERTIRDSLPKKGKSQI